MIRLMFAVLVFSALLTGCASQERRLASAAEVCEKIGFEPGTDKFKECQANSYEQDTNRRAMASKRQSM